MNSYAVTPPNQRTPRTALISPDPTFRSMVTSCLEECAHTVEWVLRAKSDVTDLRPASVDRLAERNPELLFIDIGSSPSAGARFISAITTVAPGLAVVPAGDSVGVDELLELMRAGASGYLPRPWNRNEISEVCSNLLLKMPSRHLGQAGPESVTSSHVITLFAPKGGTGVSTLAANLAVHIRRATSKNTLLLDFSPELGTGAILLGAEPRYSYLDVADNLERMDEPLLHSFLEEHESGTRVLASPSGGATARTIAREDIHAILRLARRHFEYVVVDAGRSVIDEVAQEALERSDERLLVTTAELPTLRNVKQALPHIPRPLHESDPPRDSIRLVVNRFEEGVSVPQKDVERAVGLPLFHVLEEDRVRVGRSVNLGRPVVLMKGSSPYARAVRELGDRLAAEDLEANGKSSALSGLIKTILPFARTNGARTSRVGNGAEGSSNGRRPGEGGRAASTNGRRPPAGRSESEVPARRADPPPRAQEARAR